jgi:tetratricopeptide (TPR) repeat protein
MTNGPDFIVDLSGNVRDVRHSKNPPSGGASGGTPPPSRPASDNLAGDFYRGKTVQVSYPSATRSKSNFYWIPIPIGLIITIIVALLNALGVNTTGNGISERDYQEFESAETHYLHGQYALALEGFNNVIKSNPKLGAAYNGRGLVYGDMGQYQQALADFTKAIELLPRSPIPYNNRGITYFALRDTERALRDLDKAVELGKDYAKAYFNRGLVYYERDDYGAALSNLDQAIHYSPEEPWRYQMKATIGAERNFLKELDDRMELTDRSVDLPEAYYWRAMVYAAQGEAERATADLEKALTLAPNQEQEQKIQEMLEILNMYSSPLGS